MAVFDTGRTSTADRWAPRAAKLPNLGVIASAALVATAAMLPVVQSSNTTTAGYETRQLAQQRLDLQAAILNTQAEVAELGSLSRIDREARGRMGMVPAQRAGLLSVSVPASTEWHVPPRFLTTTDEPAEELPEPAGWQALLEQLLTR